MIHINFKDYEEWERVFRTEETDLRQKEDLCTFCCFLFHYFPYIVVNLLQFWKLYRWINIKELLMNYLETFSISCCQTLIWAIFTTIISVLKGNDQLAMLKVVASACRSFGSFLIKRSIVWNHSSTKVAKWSLTARYITSRCAQRLWLSWGFKQINY